jgi:hypothetical protein
MLAKRGVQPLPEVDILYRFFSAVFQPRFFQLWIHWVIPWRTYWLSVLSTTSQCSFNAFESDDRRHQFHAVIGGQTVAGAKGFFVLAVAHDGAVTAGSWISQARAVGENFYLFEHLW